MKAFVVETPQDSQLSDIKLAEVPQPHPGPGHVLVKVHAVGLNPVDYKLVEGGGKDTWDYPHVLGLDVAGEIVEVGADVPNTLREGLRVAGHGDLRYSGSFAEYAVEPAYAMAELPDELSYEEAAALLCGAMTGYQCINRKPNLNNVQTALIHGGSGNVGGIALQLAKRHGIKVFTTCSTEKVDWVQQLDPDAVIDYTTEDVDLRVEQLTNGLGADLIVDTVSAEEAYNDLNRLAYNGQLVCVAGVPETDPNNLFDLAQSVAGVNLGGAHSSGNSLEQHDLATMAGNLMRMAADKQLNPLIEKVLPFDQLVQGLEDLKNHKVRGKLVVKVCED